MMIAWTQKISLGHKNSPLLDQTESSILTGMMSEHLSSNLLSMNTHISNTPDFSPLKGITYRL